LALNPAGKWIPRARVVNLKKKTKNCASNIKPFRYRLEKQPSKIEFFTNIYSETN